jgi:hypothetical protein
VLRIRDVYPRSRILIFTHPGSRILDLGSRIPDPKTATEERSEKIFFVIPTFLCSHKFHKIENYFSFEVLNKKIWANFQRIIELFTQKIVISSQKDGFGIRDPRSGIRELEKTYSGSRIQGSKRHRIPDPGSGSATLLLRLKVITLPPSAGLGYSKVSSGWLWNFPPEAVNICLHNINPPTGCGQS